MSSGEVIEFLWGRFQKGSRLNLKIIEMWLTEMPKRPPRLIFEQLMTETGDLETKCRPLITKFTASSRANRRITFHSALVNTRGYLLLNLVEVLAPLTALELFTFADKSCARVWGVATKKRSKHTSLNNSINYLITFDRTPEKLQTVCSASWCCRLGCSRDTECSPNNVER